MRREPIVTILDIISRFRTVRTFQEKMDLIAEGIAACGWKHVHLYVFDRDTKLVKSAAYWGIDEEGRHFLEENATIFRTTPKVLSSMNCAQLAWYMKRNGRSLITGIPRIYYLFLCRGLVAKSLVWSP